MKYLKYFKESISEITLKEKLESIISMYDYIWENDIDDSFNLTGKCLPIFLTCTEFNSEYRKFNKGKLIDKKREIRPYEFDIECLLKRLESHYRKDEILKEIEELYTFSKISKFKYTEEEIENILNPVLSRESMGYKIIKSYKIRRFFHGWYKKPCYHININIDPEFLTMDETDVKNRIYDDQHNTSRGILFKELESEFYSYRRRIADEIKSLINMKEFIIETHDNTHLNDYFKFSVILRET